QVRARAPGVTKQRDPGIHDRAVRKKFRPAPILGEFEDARNPRPHFRLECIRMDEEDPTAVALAVAREQVRHTIERLDEIRIDLEATAAGLRLPEHGADLDDPLAGLY